MPHWTQKWRFNVTWDNMVVSRDYWEYWPLFSHAPFALRFRQGPSDPLLRNGVGGTLND